MKTTISHPKVLKQDLTIDLHIYYSCKGNFNEQHYADFYILAVHLQFLVYRCAQDLDDSSFAEWVILKWFSNHRELFSKEAVWSDRFATTTYLRIMKCKFHFFKLLYCTTSASKLEFKDRLSSSTPLWRGNKKKHSSSFIYHSLDN